MRDPGHDGTLALNNAVRELKSAGKSTIIMTHRPQAISECDDLVVVEKGQIVKSGGRDEVLNTMVQNANVIKRHLNKVGE